MPVHIRGRTYKTFAGAQRGVMRWKGWGKKRAAAYVAVVDRRQHGGRVTSRGRSRTRSRSRSYNPRARYYAIICRSAGRPKRPPVILSPRFRLKRRANAALKRIRQQRTSRAGVGLRWKGCRIGRVPLLHTRRRSR